MHRKISFILPVESTFITTCPNALTRVTRRAPRDMVMEPKANSRANFWGAMTITGKNEKDSAWSNAWRLGKPGCESSP